MIYIMDFAQTTCIELYSTLYKHQPEYTNGISMYTCTMKRNGITTA